jgi:hypothetical protein
MANEMRGEAANASLMQDLEYATSLAKAGESAPLLGGPIGLLWGVLLCFIFFVQWGVLSGTFGWPQNTLLFCWIAFAVIGGGGSAIMGRYINQKPGANSAANRVETYVWTMFSGMMASLFIGIVLNMTLNGGTYQLFDLVMIVGFAGQGLAYGVVAKMSKIKLLHIASFLGFTASALCFAFYGDIKVYLIAAIATLFTIVLPSVLLMKRAGGSDG